MVSDLIVTLRQLRRTPVQTSIAILTLALGIGLSTTMGSLLKALVLDPFNYPQPDRIVQVWCKMGEMLSGPNFVDLYQQSTCFESLGAYSGRINMDVVGNTPMSVWGTQCTSGVLPVFGVSPLLGRWFGEQDEPVGAPTVAVISHGVWQRVFGGDAEIIGRHAFIDGRSTEIVGVMPPGFEFRAAGFNKAGAEECAVWTHVSLKDAGRSNRIAVEINAVARLKDGISLGAAEAELKAIAARLTQMYPTSNTGKTFSLRQLRYELTGDDSNAGERGIGSMSWMLFGAGAFVLLVACANVAGMVVAQGTARQQEFTIRLALGAGRGHLARLLLVESGMLALAGALLGLGMAAWGTSALAQLAPVPAGRVAAIRVDSVMLFFSMGLVLVSTPLVGLPVIFATKGVNAADVLRAGGRGQTGSGARQRLLGMLIIGQVAVALLLANTAVLFSASYRKVMAANKHMATTQVLAGSLIIRGSRYAPPESRVRFVTQLLQRIRELHGVELVAVTTKLPLEGGRFDHIRVGPPGHERQIDFVEQSWTSANFFATLGLRFLQGRTFETMDNNANKPGVVINRALAEMAWPDANPIGQTFKWPPNYSRQNFEGTVIGVVENTRQRGAEESELPEVYFPYESDAAPWLWLVVRSRSDARLLDTQLRNAVSTLDPDLPLGNMRTLQEVLDAATQQRKFIATIMGIFMICTVGLAMCGIYGTLSYYVVERTREIGVRMALGAPRGNIVHLVLRRVGLWLVFGIVLGVGTVFGAAQVLRSLLYEMQPVYPPVLIISVALVLIAGLAAGLAPALRTTKIEPLEALRAE